MNEKNNNPEVNCYLCHGSNLTVVRTKLRYEVSRKVFQCDDCGINFLEPQELDLAEYYRAEYRTLYSPVIGEAVDSRKTFEIMLPFQDVRVDVIKDKLGPTVKALDVGCSAGHFLHKIKPLVEECVGIEFNEENAKFVNEELGIRTYTQPIEETDIPEGYFDLITAFHMVEHVTDPIKLLSTLRKYLRPGGTLYIEVPNVDDALLSAYHLEDYAAFFYRDPHLFNFSVKTLGRVTDEAGFDGEIQTTQRYSFFNHMNWIMVGKPQTSYEAALQVPTLVEEYLPDPGLVSDLQKWAEDADNEYRRVMNRHSLGDTIVFVGHQAPV